MNTEFVFHFPDYQLSIYGESRRKSHASASEDVKLRTRESVEQTTSRIIYGAPRSFTRVDGDTATYAVRARTDSLDGGNDTRPDVARVALL